MGLAAARETAVVQRHVVSGGVLRLRVDRDFRLRLIPGRRPYAVHGIFPANANLLSGPWRLDPASGHLGSGVRVPMVARGTVYFVAAENDSGVGAYGEY